MPQTQEKKKFEYQDNDSFLRVLSGDLGAYASPLDQTAAITSAPPLDPEPQMKETPLGPMTAEQAAQPDTAAAIGGQMLKNGEKEKDTGSMPFGERSTLSVGERTAQELKKFQSEMDQNFLEQNWGKVLTMLAGTALQMVGAHNKNPSIFLGGTALTNLGGVQLKDYFRTKTQEQEAIVRQLSQEPATSRDVLSVMDMIRQRTSEKGEKLSPEEIDQIINISGLSEEQAKYVRSVAGDIGPGAGMNLAEEDAKRAVIPIVQQYLLTRGITGTPTKSQMEEIRGYLSDQARNAEQGSPLQYFRTDPGAKILDQTIQEASSSPLTEQQLQDLGVTPETGQRRLVFDEAKKYWFGKFGVPQTRNMIDQSVDLKSKPMRDSELLRGLADLTTGLGEKDVTRVTYGELADTIQKNLQSRWEIRGNQAYLNTEHPQIASYMRKPNAAGFTVTEEKRSTQIPVFKTPLANFPTKEENARLRLEEAIRNEAEFHPDFNRYIERLLSEVIAR
jgi:hypothetical protein